jgi:MFS family permease
VAARCPAAGLLLRACAAAGVLLLCATAAAAAAAAAAIMEEQQYSVAQIVTSAKMQQRRAGAGSAAVVGAQPPSAGYASSSGEDDDGELPEGNTPPEPSIYLFPCWWFAFMKAGSIPESILEGCLWTIIWPQAIRDVYGDAEKTKVLGLLKSATVAVQLLSPFVGDLADRLPLRYSRFCGRRRPFILLGHILYTCGLLCSYFGLYGEKLELMVCGSVLSGLTLMLQTPNFAALASETVPPQQRGQMATVQQQITAICNVLASLLGILVGEGVLRRQSRVGDRVIWWALFGWKIVMVPLLMMQFNGRAGWWHPEVRRRTGFAARGKLADEQRAECRGYWRDFCSAFSSEPAFLALYICGFIFWCSQSFWQPFWFFFLQDCFPSGYVLWGWRVTTSTQSLLAILNLIGQGLTALFASCGGYLRERWGGTQRLP